MKRDATKIVLFLLLGAIINVAVAWGCALRRSQSGPRQYGTWVTADCTYYVFEYGNRAGERQFWITEWSAEAQQPRKLRVPMPSTMTPEDIPPWCSLDDRSRRGESSDEWHSIVSAFGWPCLCLGHRFEDAHLLSGPVLHSTWGIDLPPTTEPSSPTVYRHHALPLRPIWPGFAINTIFYAAVLWLPFVALGRLRRRRRIKRGLCPACAYPVGDSTVCTECGKAVKA